MNADVERVTVDDERFASDLVRAHHDKLYSLCDALSFAVMEREAIAFDRHFREYGKFVILERRSTTRARSPLP